MATSQEKLKSLQEKLRTLNIRYTKMSMLWRLSQRAAAIKKRNKGRKLNTREKLAFREQIEKSEAEIAQRKKTYGITVIVDPKKIKVQMDRIRKQIGDLDTEE